MTEITREIAQKVLEVVDAGLVSGVGVPVPGQMCVEAAVCFAMGLEHGDDPPCVSRALRSLKIRLNDSAWSSDAARAKGMRRLALAQLGSRDVLDDIEFYKRIAEITIRKYVPIALRAAANLHPDSGHKEALLKAALECEAGPNADATASAARTADAAARAAADRTADAAYAAASAARTAASAARTAASAAYAAASAAYAAAYARTADTILADFAEDVVQVLIDMKAPGVLWLDLTN